MVENHSFIDSEDSFQVLQNVKTRHKEWHRTAFVLPEVQCESEILLHIMVLVREAKPVGPDPVSRLGVSPF